MDQLFVLLALLLLASLMAAIVLPIVALVISVKTRRRIEALEAALAGRRIVVEPGPEPVRAPPPPPEPVIQTPPPPIAPEPPPTPRPPRVSRPTTSLNAFELGSLIGRRGVGWVAVVLILFATAFFMKYAFDNRWIGELGRVSIGITFGIAMSLG